MPVFDGESLRCFTVLVGGGMGKHHTNPDTFPRLADPLTTVAPEELLEVLATIIGVQRDHGDRHDREHARLKYLIHEWVIGRFGAEVAQRLGRSLPSPQRSASSRACSSTTCDSLQTGEVELPRSQ